MRKRVILICPECLNRNYSTTKKEGVKDRLELMKYCPHCNKQTLHKESK